MRHKLKTALFLFLIFLLPFCGMANKPEKKASRIQPIS